MHLVKRLSHHLGINIAVTIAVMALGHAIFYLFG